jgi:hypothetical protein
MSFLSDLVVAKVRELGFEKAAEFFGVGEPLVRQWEAGTKPVSLAAVDKVFVPPERGFTDAAWEGKKVLLMLPWYKTTHPLTAFSLFALLDRQKMGAAMEFGDAMIAHARNKLLDTLVTTGVEYGFFADDDMIFPCGNAGWFNRYTGLALAEPFAGMHTLNRLMSHKKTLVSGLYFQRKESGRAVYLDALRDGAEGDAENRLAKTSPRDAIKEVEWAGTGCLLVHRSVPLDIREKMPWLAPQAPGESWHYFSSASDALISTLPEVATSISGALGEFSSGGDAGTFERRMSEASHRLKELSDAATRANRLNDGEDAVFGRRAKLAGHPTFVDFAVVCGHIGGKVYAGH